jgi:hypothetical protein
MEPVKELSIKIIQNLSPGHIKNIKSHIGFLEMCCDIVEEAYQRLKSNHFKISSEYKKNLALNLTSHLLKKLSDEELVDKEIIIKIRSFVDQVNIEMVSDIIDDIIGIWNDVKVTTLKFCPCLNIRKKSIRKLEDIKIDNSSIDEPFKISNI